MRQIVFTEYVEAAAEARHQAKFYHRPMGLEKAVEYGKTVYRVKMVPIDPSKRFGWETRCEIVEMNS